MTNYLYKPWDGICKILHIINIYTLEMINVKGKERS